ncbi:MAG: MFS transporter [Phenylobacterium sp.]|uniref:MFS transporter n=1 Tax=Phenylobacterium sp. TaxID=1871053 RepID=UPI00391B6CDB
MTVEQAAPRPAGRAGVVALCFAVALLEGYDIQAVGVAAPKLIPALGLSASQAGFAFGGGMAGLMAGAFLGGWLVDRVGRRLVLAAAVAIFGLFTLATMVAPDFTSLLGARLATGLGLGMAMPTLVAIAIDLSPPERRTATVAAMFCGMPVGGALSAVFAAFAFEHLGWRAIFLAGGLAPLALVPLLLRLPQTRAARSGPAAGPGALFAEGRTATTLLLWAAFGLTLVVLYLLLNWLPTLVTSRGLGAGAGAQAALAFNLAGVAGTLAVGAMVDRQGAKLAFALAYAGLLAAILGLAVAGELGPILACAAAAGFCLMGAQFSLYGVAPMFYPPAVRGLGAGAAVGVGRFGSITGPILAGELLALGFGAGGVAAAMAPVVAAAGAAALAAAWRGRMFSA